MLSQERQDQKGRNGEMTLRSSVPLANRVNSESNSTFERLAEATPSPSQLSEFLAEGYISQRCLVPAIRLA